MHSKSQCHNPYGFLKQLLIHEQPWNSISMDFIEQLPDSLGYTVILVIVCRLLKQGIFIPTHDTITSAALTKLFVLHVFSKHGVPSHVTSDQGSEFVSYFFKSLGKDLDMKLHFTSGYHPEGNGQTKHVNKPRNNTSESIATINRTIGPSCYPFPNSPTTMHQTLQPVSRLSSQTKDTTQTSLSTLNETLLPLKLAQSCYQVLADAKCSSAPEFAIGSHVFVKAQFFRTTRPLKKLAKKYLSPFKVISQAGSRSYTLRLLDSMGAVHLVFHVSMLEPATPNSIPNRVQAPPPPVKIDGEPEYEISEILDSKINQHHRPCNLLYLI